MAPRLSADYPIEIESISKPKADYESPEYLDLDLPVAPAVMIGDEVVAEGADIAEDKLVNLIREELGMPPVEPQKKGILGRLLGG
jgi:hypothetical protein